MGVIQLHRIKGRDTIIGTAGEDLAKYDLVYTKSGTWWKTDRDAVATMSGLGMCTGSISAGDSTYILLWGPIGNPDWTWVDGPIYASGTPGGLTQTPPTTSGYLQSVGYSYGTTFMLFDPTWLKEMGVTKTEHEHLSTGLLGWPNISPPSIVIQDNTKMLAFTVNSDDFFYAWTVPDDYAGGGLKVVIHWTNDGGVDDNGKNIKFQLSYQVYSDGDSIAGDHANSPKTADDTYTSDVGWGPHTSPFMTIAHADIAGKHAISIRGMFITADPTALTCEPHLLSVGLEFEAYVNI